MESLDTLSARLRSAMSAKGVKAVDLVRVTGAKPPSVHKWLTGGTKNLKGQNLVKTAEFLGVSDAWLAHGVPPRERAASLDWPFYPWIPYEQIAVLPESSRAYIASSIRRSLSELEAVPAYEASRQKNERAG